MFSFVSKRCEIENRKNNPSLVVESLDIEEIMF